MTAQLTPARGRLWLAFILLLPLCGCGDDGSSSPNGNGPGGPIHLPLAIGNRWTYAVTIVESGDTDTTTQVDRITGVRDYKGLPYFLMASDQTLGVSETTLVRQSAQSLLAVPGFASQVADSASTDWAVRILAKSLPWTLADFDARPGRIDFFQADTTLDGDVEFVLTLEIVSQGRTSIQTPAGGFEDAYLGRIIQTVSGREAGIAFFNYTNTTELTIADSVGVVKQRAEERILQTGEPEAVVTETALLRSYDLSR